MGDLTEDVVVFAKDLPQEYKLVGVTVCENTKHQLAFKKAENIPGNTN